MCHIFIALIIGCLFAMNGVSFKIASYGKVHPTQSSVFLASCAMAVFAILGASEWSVLSWRVVVGGLIFGLTQYVALKCLHAALRLGPLSPAWCAMSLNFVWAVVFSAVCLGEKLSVWQILSLCCTVLAIVAASRSNGSDGGAKSTSRKGTLLYGLVLAVMMLSAGVLSVGLKYFSVTCEPGFEKSISDSTGNLVMFFTYMGMLIPCAIDLTATRSWRWNRYGVIGGLMLSVGAVVAYGLTVSMVSNMPAVTLFATSNTMAILGSGLISVFFMHEKKTPSWCLTIAFSVLAILLNR